MDKGKNLIKHPGIITEIGSDTVKVSILTPSSCSNCQSKGLCSVADMESKIVEIRKTIHSNYEVGKHVVVYMEKSLGQKAILYAYIYPLLLVLLSLIGLLFLTSNEGFSALIALLLLIPYYFIIYKIKDKLSTTFKFNIL